MLAINLITGISLAVMLLMLFMMGKFLRTSMVSEEPRRTVTSRQDRRKQRRNAGKKVSSAKVSVSTSTEEEKTIGKIILIAVLVTAFLVRVVIAAMHRGHETDMNCFVLWGDMVYKNGFGKFYDPNVFTDYPPGYIYVLYVIGWLRSIFGITWDSVTSIVMTKMPAILADLGIGVLIYKVACKKFKESGAAMLSALFLFCPVVILDSVVWGQTDSVFTFFIALMCYLIAENKMIPSYFVFALAILIKPQSLIYGPVLIYGIIDNIFLDDFNWNKFWKNLGLGIVAILMIGLLMMPFGFQKALAQYTDTLGSYEYASVNAYNFWTLCGLNWKSQDGTKFGLTFQQMGSIAIVLTVVVATILCFRRKKDKSKYFYLGAFIVTCVFLFSVRMHERYIYPAVALLILAYAMRPRKETYILYSLLSAVCFYNVAYVLFFYNPSTYNESNPVMFIVSFAALAVFGYMVYVTVKCYSHSTTEKEEAVVIASQTVGIKSLLQKKEKGEKKVVHPSQKTSRMKKEDYIVMGVITIIYAIVAFMHLGNKQAPETTYSVAQQGVIQLDFGQEVTFSTLWDFLGYKNNPTYHIDYTNDVSGEWTQLYTEENAWDAGSVFCWNSTDMPITARYISIYTTAQTTEDSLQELIFLDASGNKVLPVNAGSYENLFDEQDLFEGRKTCLNGTYFDEIYHARTAYEMIHNLYCYENTHPPLGKFIMSLGIRMFGMNPFGWRFMGTLFGVLMLPIIYAFARRFFKETWISGIVTVLFAFDFMHFVQTRIATIDVFVTLFIILAYYLMYCYSCYSFYDTKLSKTFIPLGLCGIVMGISWASKWTGIYASAGLAVIFFALMIQRGREYVYASRNPEGTSSGIKHSTIIEKFPKYLGLTILFCIVFFVIIPVIIYTLSYIPVNDGTDRGLIERMIESQKTMFNYHNDLKSEHPYSSKWYQWPIMYRPMWYYSGVISDTVREGISAFGNPLVWWTGIPAFAVLLYRMLFKKDGKAAFLVVGYLSQYAPWILIGRVVFIYHYFPSVPFVVLMIAYCMYLIVQKYPKSKKWMYVYAGAAVALFIMFYPVLAGRPTTIEYANEWLKWFKTWVLIQTW